MYVIFVHNAFSMIKYLHNSLLFHIHSLAEAGNVCVQCCSLFKLPEKCLEEKYKNNMIDVEFIVNQLTYLNDLRLSKSVFICDSYDLKLA